MAPLDIPSLKFHVSPEEWQLRCDLAAAYGLMFDEITASSLIKVDRACNKLQDSPFPVNPAGFTIHGAVHEVREDTGCVLHTHTYEGVAFHAD